jgi:hypothetical protein
MNMLALWLLVQLAVLALAAGRVSLSARFPEPAEQAATMEMLVAQIALACLLFPALFRTGSHWLLATASVWIMLRLAALLGGESTTGVYAAASYVTCWLATLAIWRLVLRSERWQLIAAAAAALWAIGGPILLYLHAEYGGASQIWPSEPGFWAAVGGPIWGAVARLPSQHLPLPADIPLATLLISGFVFALFRIRQTAASSRQVIHTISTKK